MSRGKTAFSSQRVAWLLDPCNRINKVFSMPPTSMATTFSIWLLLYVLMQMNVRWPEGISSSNVRDSDNTSSHCLPAHCHSRLYIHCHASAIALRLWHSTSDLNTHTHTQRALLELLAWPARLVSRNSAFGNIKCWALKAMQSFDR